MRLQAIALMGATGTGKSALAMQLAAADDLCLISCDSMQVYRQLDIGTAKPTLTEQQDVRHALIDCADITQVWNANTWARAAQSMIKKENAQGKVPLIVGGTGMYLKALLEGFAEVPPEKEGVREHFEAMQQQWDTPYLYAKLQQVDAPLAARLAAHDTQRIIRGLSVFESTGIALSSWHQKQDKVKAETRQSIHCPVFVLEADRESLRQALAQRFHKMVDRGLLDETKWLQAQGLADTHPVMRAVGYRQLLNHLEGLCSLEDAIVDGITATRRYAKRQRTWFRNQTKDALRGDARLLLAAMQTQSGMRWK